MKYRNLIKFKKEIPFGLTAPELIILTIFFMVLLAAAIMFL